MAYYSIIRNFANLGVLQYEDLRKRFSIEMPRKMLQFCGTYYKNVAKRDPALDEICMLDKLVSARTKSNASVAPVEFLTNDAFVARTYADLIKKRRALYPAANAPCTLGEAVNIATQCMRRTKGAAAVPVVLSPENVRDSVSYPDPVAISASGSSWRQRILPLKQAALTAGDALVLVAPLAEDSPAQFRRKSVALMQNKELMQYLKGVSVVGKDGILPQLLDMTDGALIHLSALSPVESSMPATVLCEGFVGCRILRINAYQWNQVVAILANGGVRALPFASIKQEPQFVFVRDKKTAFTIDTHFLRALTQGKTVSAKLADEAAASIDTIRFGGIGGGACAYLSPDMKAEIGEVVLSGETLASASHTSPARAPFKSTLWSVIAPVAALCTCGVSREEQTLSLALEFPTDISDPYIAGNCTATVLGLYRAQAELGLPCAGGVPIRSADSLTSAAVSTWAFAMGTQKVASSFQKNGSTVYAVAPSLDHNGMPDFAALRQMLDQITKYTKEGKVLSARVLTGEAITDGIRKMSTRYSCLLQDAAVAAEGKLPLCILIESEAYLPLHRIGVVRPYKRLPRETVLLPEKSDLIACEHPDVVLVAGIADSDAMALAALLEEHGARVTLITDTEGDAVALCRAIMTTQTLILCHGVTLPQTKQLDFALATLQSAGGRMLSLDKKAAPCGFVALKNGIDAEILQKICQ